MSWGMAQAGDRASQTGHYRQWWDKVAECPAATSGENNLHHNTFSFPVVFSPFEGDVMGVVFFMHFNLQLWGEVM